MELKLCVEAWEETPEISAQELAQRLLRRFPSTVIDWGRGNAHVQEGLERLIALGAADVLLESHRAYFGNVVFTSVSEGRWEGATATSYLRRMWPPLGDAVYFDVQGATSDAIIGVIASELGAALGMVPCSEAAAKHGADADPSPLVP